MWTPRKSSIYSCFLYPLGAQSSLFQRPGLGDFGPGGRGGSEFQSQASVHVSGWQLDPLRGAHLSEPQLPHLSRTMSAQPGAAVSVN